jgi:hypothetical protein
MSGEEVMDVLVSFKGQVTRVPVSPSDSVAQIFDFLEEALSFPREFTRLVYKGKIVSQDESVSRAGLDADAKVLMVASSAADVESIRASKPDPLVKGFAEELRDQERKKARAAALAQENPWGMASSQHETYR